MSKTTTEPGRSDEGSFARGPDGLLGRGSEPEVRPIAGAALVGAWMGLGWAPLIGMIAGFVVGATSSPTTVGQGIVVGSLVGALVGPVVGALVGRASAGGRTEEERAGGVLREA